MEKCLKYRIFQLFVLAEKPIINCKILRGDMVFTLVESLMCFIIIVAFLENTTFLYDNSKKN